ncbi:hypothetical protein [Anaerocolumna jejuensis]
MEIVKKVIGKHKNIFTLATGVQSLYGMHANVLFRMERNRC